MFRSLCIFSSGLLLFGSYFLSAQIKIGDNPKVQNPNTLLEVESSNKGVIFPRMDTSSVVLTPSEENMSVYDPLMETYVYWTGKSWRPMSSGMFFNGTTSEDQAVFVANNKQDTKVGIGTTSPTYILEIDADADVSDKSDNVVVTDKGQLIVGLPPAKSDNSLLEFNSVNEDKGIMFPKVTTPIGTDMETEGMVAYHNTLKGLVFYDANQWVTLRNYFVSDPANKRHELMYKSDQISNRAQGEEFVITDDGRVGVGMKDPKYKLDVKGNINVSDELIVTKKIVLEKDKEKDKVLTSDANGVGSWKHIPKIFKYDPANTMVYIPFTSLGIPNARTLDTSLMIKDEGAIGIGIFENELQASKDIFRIISAGGMFAFRDKRDGVSAKTFENLITTNTASLVAKGLLIDSRYNATGNETSFVATPDGVNKNSNFMFYTSNTDVTSLKEQMRITFEGNIGLGVSTPSQALHMSKGKKIRIEEGAATTTGGVEGYLLKSDKDGVGSWAEVLRPFVRDPVNKVTYLGFQSDKTTVRGAGTEFLFDDDGNMGIGVASPSSKLDIIGVLKAREDIRYNKKASLDVQDALIASSVTTPNITIKESLKIVDGAQGKDKVLTSDNNGVAKWEHPQPLKVTTAERDNIAVKGATNNGIIGIMVYDTDIKKLLTWSGDRWMSPGMRVNMTMYWSGDVNRIPAGWEKVNNSDERIIVNSGNVHMPFNIGGSNSHIKPGGIDVNNVGDTAISLSQMPVHVHTIEVEDVRHYHKLFYDYTMLVTSDNRSGVTRNKYRFDDTYTEKASVYVFTANTGLILDVVNSTGGSDHRHTVESVGNGEGHNHSGISTYQHPKWFVPGYLIKYDGL